MMHFFFVIISSRNWVTLTTINCCQNEPNQIMYRIELHIEVIFFIKYACTISDEILPKSYSKNGIMQNESSYLDLCLGKIVISERCQNLDAKNSLDPKRALKNDVI